MNAPFQFTPQATEGLDTIWCLSPKTAGTLPTGRKWKSSRPVGGWRSIPDGNQAAGHYAPRGALLDAAEISNYVIVYRPDTSPLQVVAVLHGSAT